MCRKRGRIVLVGISGLNISREDFYKKELTLRKQAKLPPYKKLVAIILLSKELDFLKDSLSHIKEQKRIKEVNLAVFLEEKDLFNENKSVLKTTREFIVDDLMPASSPLCSLIS